MAPPPPTMARPIIQAGLCQLAALLVLPLLILVLALPAAHAGRDRWGAISSQAVPEEAVALFDEAVVGYVSLRGDVVGPLTQAIELAPEYLMAHIYLGSILLLSTGVTKEHPLVRQSYAAARNLTKAGSPNARELGYWKALRHLHDGVTPDFAGAARCWEEVVEGNPRDLLAVRSAHDAYIILGDVQSLRASLAHVLSRREWEVDDEDHEAKRVADEERRYVRSMWAFALEESGDYTRAAVVAKKVLAEDPTDVTALHAYAHVFEMASLKEEGEAMYQEFAGKWEGLQSLFINHVAWHRAVFDMELVGEQDHALELYDRFLVKDGGRTGPATPLAMADAASLLWRLSLKGVAPDAVGERWQALRRFYAQGGYESAHTTSFNDVHMLLCLAVADPPAARAALASMRRRARQTGRAGRLLKRLWRRLVGRRRGEAVDAQPTNPRVLAAVGLQVGEAVVAFAEGDYRKAVDLLVASMPRWIMIGGSHAQRDVLMLTLLEACLRNETDLRLARRLLAERAEIKDPDNQEGVWDRLRAVEARLVLEGPGEQQGARSAESDEL